MALKVSKINIPGILPNGEIEVDEATIAAAVAEYIAEHPITVTETDPTVPSWAKQPTKPTYTAGEVGAYSKPSGGIPKTDLASDVQTSLGKADTALQSHQSLAGYATETWVQNQGYLTQHQSLSAYQTKAITDTGGYFTTDTVEGALQEIGAELAGINTLIGSGVIT